MTVLTDPDDPRRQDDQRPHDAPPPTGTASGEIARFTGVSDPYEAPHDPECRIDTSQLAVDAAVDQLLRVLASGSGERGTRGLTRHTSS